MHRKTQQKNWRIKTVLPTWTPLLHYEARNSATMKTENEPPSHKTFKSSNKITMASNTPPISQYTALFITKCINTFTLNPHQWQMEVGAELIESGMKGQPSICPLIQLNLYENYEFIFSIYVVTIVTSA